LCCLPPLLFLHRRNLLDPALPGRQLGASLLQLGFCSRHALLPLELS
jgi:hypothetical protein